MAQQRNTDTSGNGGREQAQDPGIRDQAERTQFVEGGVVHVWKPTGVRKLKYGIQTSERTGGEFPDVRPEEALEVIERLSSGKALCRRPDREGQADEKIIVHINHINRDSKYYSDRKGRSQQGTRSATSTGMGGERGRVQPPTPQERLQSARDLMEQARQEHDAALKEMEAVAEEMSGDLPYIDDEEEERVAN